MPKRTIHISGQECIEYGDHTDEQRTIVFDKSQKDTGLKINPNLLRNNEQQRTSEEG